MRTTWRAGLLETDKSYCLVTSISNEYITLHYLRTDGDNSSWRLYFWHQAHLKSCHWNSTLTLPQSPKKVSSPPTFGITILSVTKAPVFSGSSVTGESLWESEWMFIPSDWSVWQPTCACFYLFIFWRLAWTCPLVLQTCLWVQPGMFFFFSRLWWATVGPTVGSMSSTENVNRFILRSCPDFS